jgi:hypothetical protein
MIGQQGQMNQDFDKFAARAAPAVFVLLWSTGFIGTKYVINNADPCIPPGWAALLNCRCPARI